MTQTFTKLDKDIQWEYKGAGKYDRAVQGGDFIAVDGEDALREGMRFALLTAYDELFQNPVYKEWGNKAYLLLQQLDSPTTMINLREYFREVLKKISRIKSVDVVKVEQNPDNQFGLYVIVKVTSIDDSTVKMGVGL